MSTKVAELTVDEFKQLIATTSLEAEPRGLKGISAQEVAAQLGMEW